MYKQDIEEAIRDSVSGDAEDAYLGLGIDYIWALVADVTLLLNMRLSHKLAKSFLR